MGTGTATEETRRMAAVVSGASASMTQLMSLTCALMNAASVTRYGSGSMLL